ncbi:zinc-dependent peptidase [Kangiella sp. TOML190]|uniref:M90 family metallopeptidase n=1 Tax=Kangiella sp. TOML190 TaxID=2931351 RepID=UPI00203E4615|nr:M90 family metallopeptidase [Kangiella sp. TOML190]
MTYLLIIIAISAFAIYWIITSSKRKAKQRKSIASIPFPAQWRKILRKNLPFFYQMPADLQLQLKDKMQIFLAEKQFVGRQGQTINDEVRVTIAAQACLLLLNRNTDFYPFLKTIVVYPAAFITQHEQYDASGIKTQDARVLLGESWTRGQVILSWRDSASGGADFEDGHNLVIHEFAHQLDGESGVTNGAPPLNKDQSYQEWSQVLSSEFAELQKRARTGEASFLDKYGATNPAEFFAVTSEVFFEKPKELKQIHPDLYRQLAEYYRVNPVDWKL